MTLKSIYLAEYDKKQNLTKVLINLNIFRSLRILGGGGGGDTIRRNVTKAKGILSAEM
jgi:hypothetical protein